MTWTRGKPTYKSWVSNIVNAAHCARDRNLTVLTLSGFDANNPLRALGHQNLWVNSRHYNIVETVHQSWLLACVDGIAAGTGGGEQ